MSTTSGSRRRFLGAFGGAVGAAGAGLLGATPGLAEEDAAHLDPRPDLDERYGRDAGRWIPSCCHMCGGTCGINVHVVEGRVTKIEPNQWNPGGFTNVSDDFYAALDPAKGLGGEARICAKGNSGIMALYDPDRLKAPLRRTNPEKGIGVDPGWKEITWDEALGEIAGRLKDLRDRGEAHRLVWLTEDASFTNVQGDFCKLYGTPNYYMHSNLCDVARKAAFKMVMGHDRPLCDFMHTKYAMLFGWNPTSALKWMHLGRIIPKAIENGARLVVVDPYMSDTAVKAHEWVPIRPGTDGALALAMAGVIVRERLYDEAFVRDWTLGFEEFAASVRRQKTPAWGERITGIPAATIVRLAREVATTRPALVDAWSGAGNQSNGVAGVRAIAALNVLIGSYDAQGGMVIPNKKGGKHVEIKADAAAQRTLVQPFLDGHDKLPFGHGSGCYAELFRRIAEGEGPYRPDTMVIVFQNPMMAVPGTRTVERALKRVPFTVAIDTMPSETVQMADIALPGTVYLERYEICSHWVTWPAIGLRQPVVAPLFGQPTEYETVALLGRRIDLADADGKRIFLEGRVSGGAVESPTRWYEEYLSRELKDGAPGLTLEEMRTLPGAVWTDRAGTKYRKYAEPLKPEALATAVLEDGRPLPPVETLVEGTGVFDKAKSAGGKRIGIVRRLGGSLVAVRGFDTPSGKAELAQPKLAEKKDFRGNPLDPLPTYRPRDVQPSAEYPLYYIGWKDAMHTQTRTWNNQWLRELRPEAPLMIHPETARRLGIAEGDEVAVESPQGSIRMHAHLTKRIHRQVVGAQHGGGHWALGRFASKGGGNHSGFLTATRFEPISGQSCNNEVCVRIRKVAGSSPTLPRSRPQEG